jgi:hypothetical protein
MHTAALRSLCVLVALAVLPCRVSAQDWPQPWSDPRDRPPRVDLSISAGVVSPTDWSDLVLLGSISSATGALEQVLVRDLRIEPDSVFGAAVTYWRDRYGFRAHGALSRSRIVTGAALEAGAADELRAASIDSWFYDVRAAVGLVKYSPTRLAWPYVFVGLGGITYDLDRTITPPLLTFIEGGNTRPQGSGGVVIVEDDGREFLLSIDELGQETVFALNFGVGTDFRIPFGGGGLGVRLEFSDHVSSSPLGLRIRELGSGLTSDSAVSFGAVHHLRLAAGLVVQIGR